MSDTVLDVLHVLEACGGGVRRHLRLIVPALMARGVRCGVFAFGGRYDKDFPEDLAYYEKLGCKVWSLPYEKGGNLTGVPRAARCLCRLLKDEQPRTMHLHASVAGLAGRLVSKSVPGLNVVYSPHAFAIHPSLPWGVRVFIRLVESLGKYRTDAYAFVGRSEINDANLLRLPPERFHLIENGLPSDYREHLLGREEARRRLGLPLDEKIAVVPCRLVRQKGLPQLLEAVAAAQGEARRLRVVFCGDGPERGKLQAMAASRGISERLQFPGAVPELATLLNAFDVAVLPSLYEGLSYVLLECLAAGIPLVVSDIYANVPRPELRECVQTFQVGDIKALSAKLEATVANLDSARERAQIGVTFMKNDFTLDLQADKLVTLYKGLF